MRSPASDDTVERPAFRDMESKAHQGNTALTPARIALTFSSVPLIGSPEAVAAGCVAAVRSLFGRARLVLPPAPMALVVGDAADGLVLACRFGVPGGEAELWLPLPEPAPRLRAALVEQLSRVWSVQRVHAEQEGELERMRFHLAALQQVNHTLAGVRGVEEAERIALDSVKEVFFAWWAALYRKHPRGDYHARQVRAHRDEQLARSLDGSVVTALLHRVGSSPSIPAAEEPIRRRLPDDLSVVVPLELDEDETALLILGPRMSGEAYAANDLTLLRALADASAVALRNAELHDQLRAQAIRDALTGCLNRRGFEERFALEFARARRYRRPLSLVYLDLDEFKRLNDVHGHAAGDHALRRVGEVVRSGFRSTDAICRIGGEEFACIFPETSKEDALNLAERLRALLTQLEPDALVPTSVTGSLGVASYPTDARDAEDLLRAADRALYAAKSGGRNRVVAAGSQS